MGKNDKKSKESKKTGKYLDHGTVVLNTITRRINVHNTIYCWRIFKYPRLELNVLHFQVFKSKNVMCVLKLLKTKNTLYLCLRCDQLVKKTAHFYLISETQPTYVSTKAEEIRDGLYTGEFKYELFEDPGLPYLQDGMLTISFRYVSDHVTNDHETTFDGVDILSDLDELCCDLKHMYLESMYPDFEVKTKDYVFKAHKFILSARCKFFENFFNNSTEAREFTVDTSPGILHEVLLYVYCGELSDMDLACMWKVLDLAYDLKITSLIDKCHEYFNTHVDKSNFDEFSAMVEETQCPDLFELLENIRIKLYV